MLHRETAHRGEAKPMMMMSSLLTVSGCALPGIFCRRPLDGMLPCNTAKLWVLISDASWTSTRKERGNGLKGSDDVFGEVFHRVQSSLDVV